MKLVPLHRWYADCSCESAVSEGYEIWSVDGKPISVHLRMSAGGQIRYLAEADPGKASPVEIGGILWGRVRDTGESYFIVSVEQADTFECGHERGEGWVLSDADRAKFKKRLAEKHGDLRPVGFWRTHRRQGLYLDKRDFDLMAAFFPHPWCVALCVRPPATAGFFVWEQGDIRGTSSYREFRLPDAVQPASAALPVKRRQWPASSKWAAAAVIAAVVIITPLLLKSTGTSGSPFNMLSMQAESKPGVVRLSWNPRSKVLSNGQGAVVWIADGAEESKLELTPEQVRAGSIEYKPSGNDINFRMEVGQFTESLRVHGADPGESRTRQAEVTIPEPKAPAVVRNEPKPKRSPKTVTLARVIPLPSPVAPIRDVELLAPPQLTAIPPTRLEDRPPLPPRSMDVPKVMATVEKPHSSPLKRAFGWMIPNRRKDFVPAKVVRQFQPHVRTKESTDVAVRVSIDQKGIVRDADLLTKDVDGHLGRSAVEAAKRWKFEPARMEDRPVASNLVVRFRFTADR